MVAMAEAVSSKDVTQTFRASMRVLASSVCLVTARDGAGKFHGMAITSACSLTMDPPAMLIAVNRTTSIHPIICSTGRFCINIMAQKHSAQLEKFSRSDLREKRFDDDAWEPGYLGLPTLKGALATHSCSVAQSHDFGTHTVFFGAVDDVFVAPEGEADPIIWMNGKGCAVAM